MSQHIEVRIAPSGEITIVTHGIKGPACLDDLEALCAALDAPAVDSEFTGDFFTAVSPEVKLTQRREGFVDEAP